MKKHTISIIVMMLALVFVITACSVQFNDQPQEQSKSFKLLDEKVSFTELLINQDEQYSDLALEADTDIWVIVQTKGVSLAESFLKQSEYNTLSDFILSAEGVKKDAQIKVLQQEIKEEIEAQGIAVSYKYSYTTLFNGFAAYIKYGDIAKLEDISGVTKVSVAESFSTPDVESTSNSADIPYLTSNTGIYNNNTEYQGDGMLIAIIDTGIDYDHTAFHKEPENGVLSYDSINQAAWSFYGNSEGDDYTADDFYYNAKIPFMFDYADFDPDAKPDYSCVNYYAGYHGTHVAGIAAGNDDIITGSAPNAQLASMKVFSDYSANAYVTDITAALSDAALLGADVINLSLGTPAGFTKERSEDLNFLNEIYNLLDDLGICVVTSCGNAHSIGSVYSDGLPSAANPDTGVVGSPGSYSAAFATGSVDAYAQGYFTTGSTAINYNNAQNQQGLKYDFHAQLLKDKDRLDTYLVNIPDDGSEEDYAGIDVTGKIALVIRGGSTNFNAKQAIAAEHGAIACIIYNNQDGEIIPVLSEQKIPTCAINQSNGLKLIEMMQNGELAVTFKSEDLSYKASSFSSWGALSNLSLKPDMTAPGGEIYSAMPLEWDDGDSGFYTYLSGTSMATPNQAGMIASVKQYLKSRFPSLTTKELQTMTYRLLMSTADQVKDLDGLSYSPRIQGAGIANINNAFNAQAYLSVTGSNRTKLELGDDKAKAGIYTLSFNLVNFGNSDLSYEVNTEVLTESVFEGKLLESPYLLNQGNVQISVENGVSENGIVTVAAGQTAKIKVIITLSEQEKAYMNDSFENGIYVEGYVVLTAMQGPDLSIPFLAFYGDWTDAPIFDNTAYDTEESFIYESTLRGLYDNLFYNLGSYSTYVLPEGYDVYPEVSYDKIAISANPEAGNQVFAIYLSMLRNVTKLTISVRDAQTGFVYTGYYLYNISKAFEQDGIVLTNVRLEFFTENYPWANNQTLELVAEGILDYNGRNRVQELVFPLFIDSEAPVLLDADIVNSDDRILVDMEVYDNHHLQNIMLCSYDDQGNIVTAYDRGFPIYEFNKGIDNHVTLDITDFAHLLNNGELVLALNDYAFNQNVYYIGNVLEGGTSTNHDGNSINTIVYNEQSVSRELSADDDKDPNDPSYFTVSNGVLTAYTGPATDIVIPSDMGITQIGSSTSLFRRNETVTSVVIPEGVTSFASNAFDRCYKLTKVVLPTTLKTIGNYCFQYCTDLVDFNLQDTMVSTYNYYCFFMMGVKELTFPKVENKATISMYALHGLLNLERLTFNCDIATFGDVLTVCPELKELVFNGNVDNFSGGNYIFSTATKLEKLEFHGKIGNIGGNSASNYAFSGIGVKEINFYNDVGAISGSNFSNCPNLEKVTFHANVGEINGNPFGMSNKLTRFSVSEDNQYLFVDQETGIMYDNAKTKMMMPSSWSYDGIIEVPETVEKIYPAMFSHSPGYLSEINWYLREIASGKILSIGYTPLNSYTQERDGITQIILPDKFTDIPNNMFKDNINLESISCNKDIKTVGNYAYQNCKALKELHFTETLTRVGTNAFTSCESLESVTLSSNIKTLGRAMFMDCTSLKAIDLSYITRLYDEVFSGCTSLENVIISNNMTIIGNKAFLNCSSLKQIEIPDSVTQIGSNAFSGCSAITDVSLGNSLYLLGSSAFADTTFESITLPKSLTNTDFSTLFLGNPNLKNIVIQEGNPMYSSVNNVVFDSAIKNLLYYPAGCTDEKYVAPNTLDTICYNAFNGHRFIKEVVANSAITLEETSFANSSIRSFTSDSLKYVDTAAFRNSALEEFEAPVLEIISIYAFENTRLTEVRFVSSLTEVSYYAFNDCLNLSKVIFDEKAPLVNFPYTFLGCTIDDIEVAANAINYIWEDGILYNGNRTLIHFAKTDAVDLVIAEGVEKISAFAFINSKSIQSITLPKTLKAIGDKAFYGCDNLKTITFKSEQAPLLEGIYDTQHSFFCANFIDYAEELTVELTIYHPEHSSYLNYFWRLYFKNHNILGNQ